MRPVLTILPCLALAACSSAQPDPRGVGRDEVLLQVSAGGRTDTRPDEARFTAGLDTIAPTAAAASSQNSAGINRIVAALSALGVKSDDVQTRSITLSRIDYGPNRGRFQASNLIEVRVRDLKRAGEAIAATTDAGGNVLSGQSARLRPGSGEPFRLRPGLQGGAGAGRGLCRRGGPQGGAGAGDPRRRREPPDRL